MTDTDRKIIEYMLEKINNELAEQGIEVSYDNDYVPHFPDTGHFLTLKATFPPLGLLGIVKRQYSANVYETKDISKLIESFVSAIKHDFEIYSRSWEELVSY